MIVISPFRMNIVEQLWETTMNPATRILVKVTMDDAMKADEIFALHIQSYGCSCIFLVVVISPFRMNTVIMCAFAAFKQS